MPTYNSNILLNIKLTANSNTLDTEIFSENIVDELYDVLTVHLSNTVDAQEINFENVTTELVTPPASSTNYTSLSSLNTEQETNSYTPISSLNSPSSEYTPLVG